MEFILEIVLQFVGELFLQFIFQILAELGFRSLADVFKRPRNAVLSIMGFVLWGAIAGGISLLILPKSPISNLAFRKINIVITPLMVGGAMMIIGRARRRNGQNLVRLDRFSYAFIFALSMAIIRYIWAA